MNRLNLLLAASLVAVSAAAHADTVINLNATTTADGNVFYKTLNASNLAAGTYTASFVNAGYKASDGTTAAYTAFSKYAPPTSNWEDTISYDTTGATFNTSVVAGYGLANTYSATGSPTFGTNNHNYATAADAFAAVANTVFTFTIGNTGGITFYIQDQPYNTYPGYSDNSGGASLDIKVAPTPEPSSLILLGTGALGLAGAVRRRFTK